MRAPKKKPARKTGRPTKYTEALAARICDHIAGRSKESKGRGMSVPQVAEQPGMPCERTIWHWLADPKHAAFAQAYAEAGVHRGEVLVDQALEVSRETLERSKQLRIVEEKGVKVPVMGVDKSEVAAARLHVDTLMKRAGQLAPKKYGPLVRHAGEEGGPITVEVVRFGEKGTGE